MEQVDNTILKETQYLVLIGVTPGIYSVHDRATLDQWEKIVCDMDYWANSLIGSIEDWGNGWVFIINRGIWPIQFPIEYFKELVELMEWVKENG